MMSQPMALALLGALTGSLAVVADGPSDKVAIVGRVVERPAESEAKGTDLWIVRRGVPLPKSPTRVRSMPVYSAQFATNSAAGWRVDMGSPTAEGRVLVASGQRNLLVRPDIQVKDCRITAVFRSDRVGGILIRYRDASNFILAFYSPVHKIAGFHDMRTGNYGPWINPVSTERIQGKTVRMTVEVEGGRFRSVLQGEERGRATTTLKLS